MSDEPRYMTRSDVEALGFPRRAVDAIFRDVPTIHLPGYSRLMISREDLDRYVREHTYRKPTKRVKRQGYDGGRVRPIGVESPQQDAADGRANGRRRLTGPPSRER